ncbi:CCDC93, partial [Symbiodinium microadriaticum]
ETLIMDQTSETEKVYQRQKYDEIIEILLSAGYFRARINTLSEFDKVVGGLCWCIISSGEDVDVDILFQENSTIGQRIALSEAIVTALRKMNCPANLQPHQIQGGVGGSDFPAIFPVIVWLVKKFYERRDEREAQLRAFSTLQFSKNFQFPHESESRAVSADLAAILERNKAKRLFKCRAVSGASEEIMVRSCLLEYGETFASGGSAGADGGGSSNAGVGQAKKSDVGAAGESEGGAAASVSVVQSAMLETGKRVIHIQGDGSADISLAGLTRMGGAASRGEGLSGFEKKLAQAHAEAQKEEAQFAAEAHQMQQAIMQNMSQIDSSSDGSAGISGSSVGQIVGLGSSEIGSAVAAYRAEVEEARKTIDENLSGGKLGGGQSAALKRQAQNLEKQKDQADVKAAALRGATQALLERMQVLEDERDSAQAYSAKLRQQLDKLAELEANASQQHELEKLKDLVSLNETLRGQESAFKESCKAQMQELKAMISAAEGEDSKDSEEEKKLRDIEDMHGKVMAKYNRLRGLLAQTNLELARNIRIIDDVPTRSELIQYERRFVELYQQVAWKLDETKKYYAMYNTLDSTLSFLQKEIKLLNSIGENFDDAMSNSISTAEYLQQFSNIVKGVEDSLRRQIANARQREQQVEDLKATHQNLVDEQRKYFKAVKDFQEECTKNEWLAEKLEQLSHQQQ